MTFEKFIGDSKTPQGAQILADFQEMFIHAMNGKTVVVGVEVPLLIGQIIIEVGSMLVAIDREATREEYIESNGSDVRCGAPDKLFYAVKIGRLFPPGSPIQWLSGEDWCAAKLRTLADFAATGRTNVVGSTNPLEPGAVLFKCKAGRLVIIRRATREEYLRQATPQAKRDRRPFYYECRVELCGS